MYELSNFLPEIQGQSKAKPETKQKSQPLATLRPFHRLVFVGSLGALKAWVLCSPALENPFFVSEVKRAGLTVFGGLFAKML